MGSYRESSVDGSSFRPTACLTELLPEKFIRKTAAETGFIKRERKIDPVMFWVVVLGFGVNFMGSMRALKKGL